MSVTELYEKGYTIIKSLISDKTCDDLKAILDTKFSTDLPYNYFEGHYQLSMPTDLNNIPSEILFNKEVHKLITEVFGKKLLHAFIYV